GLARALQPGAHARDLSVDARRPGRVLRRGPREPRPPPCRPSRARPVAAPLLRGRQLGGDPRLVEGAERPRADEVGGGGPDVRRADPRGRARADGDEARMRNAFSVDVEDWYQVSDFESVIEFSAWDRYESRVVTNTERVLDLLAEHDVKATFFVLTWNAERYPALVRRIAAEGHEVASHGYRHRLIYEQTPAEFRDDIMRAKKILE